MPLTESQRSLVEAPLNQRIFLEGPANCGKTTVGVERLLHLMQQGVPADSILLLLPQRTLAGPYLEAIHHPGGRLGLLGKPTARHGGAPPVVRDEPRQLGELLT